MSRATIDLVLATIDNQDVDTLSAEDLNGGGRLGYGEGKNKAELRDLLLEIDAAMLVAYRVTLSSTKVDRKRGNKSISQRPFVYVLGGRGAYGPPSPTTNAPPAAQSPSLPLSDLRTAARDSVLVEVKESELTELRARVLALEKENEELSDEAEEMGSAAEHGPRPWWETEEGGKQIMETAKPFLQDLSAAMRAFLFKTGARPMQRAEGGTQQPPPALDSVTPEDLDLLRMFRQFKQADPELAGNVEQQLREAFGTKPTENGQDHNG